jgi:hypothetical protein
LLAFPVQASTVHLRAAADGLASDKKTPALIRLVPQGDAQAEVREIAAELPVERTVDLPAGSAWKVEAHAEGFWAEEKPLVVAGQGRDAVSLQLLRTGDLQARVEIPAGERPVSELAVHFEPVPTARKEAGFREGTVSCPLHDGLWRCSVPAGRLDLRIHAAGYIPLYRWGVPASPTHSLDLGSLSLHRGASVAGWVTLDPSGAPSSPVTVRLIPDRLGLPDRQSDLERLQSLARETRSNERGFFQIEGVAPGQYVLQVDEPGFAPARVAPIVVREGLQSELLDPVVLARPTRLGVAIRPAVDPYGQPWRIRLYQEREPGELSSGRWEGTASSEGRWSQEGLAPGDYQILVLGDLDSRWVSRDIHVAADQPPVEIEVPVVEVEGRITLGEEPLETTIWLGGRSGVRRIRFDSDEKGHFNGFLPKEGKWDVEIESESGGLRLRLEPVEVKVAPGKSVARLEMRAPNTRLTGEVVDDEGHSVHGAVVRVIDKIGAEVRTDEKGEFEIRGVRPGLQGLEAEDGDRISGAVEVLLQEDREPSPIKLVVRRPAALMGRVLAPTGPVPGAELIAWPSLDEVGFASASQGVTGPDGKFRLDLPAGTRLVHLVVFPPGYALRMLAVQVAPDRPVEIPVDSAGGSLVIELPGFEPGGPLPLLAHNGSFTLIPLLMRWMQLQRVHPDDPRRLVVPNVEPGAYSLCSGASSELRQGKEPHGDGRCASGVLPPFGELVLRSTTRGGAP